MIGQNVSHFRILSPLPQPGGGEVWLAHDLKAGRMVAVKLLPAVPDSERPALDRALREARAVCAPSHPHICTVHETGAHGGHPFLVMEVAQGEPLGARIASGPLDPLMVLDFGVQIADALQTAHSRGIVHGALDPEGILVTEGDQLKVMNFGIARLGGSEPAGDAAADIRALGGILHAMAAGPGRDAASRAAHHGPADGSSAAVRSESTGADNATEGKGPVRASLGPRFPAELDRIIDRAIGAEAAEPYASAGELAEDLVRVMSAAAPEVPPLPAEPVGAPLGEEGGGMGLRTIVAGAIVLAAIALILRACL